MALLDNQNYVSGGWLQVFLDVTMIAQQKKNKAKKCSDHRNICPILHTGKNIERILTKRLESKIEEVTEDKFVFQKGKISKSPKKISNLTSITHNLL